MQHRTLTVLIAEDEPTSLEMLRETLARDHMILVANNGREALDLAGSELPDLILLDIMLPGMNGYEVCRMLKTDVRTRDIPVIFVTALIEEQDETKGLEIGAVDYIPKPISPAIVRARVRNHIELKHYQDYLENLSALDALTGIANRRGFDIGLDREWRRAVRRQSTFSVILIDIDFFKAFNDHYGHLAGDECLRRIAAVLAESLKRPGDLAARYGGEEFACLLPETDLAGATSAAHRMQQGITCLRIPHAFSTVAEHVTVSFGVATLIPALGQSSSDLLRAADQRLYKAKANGRNRVSAA